MNRDSVRNALSIFIETPAANLLHKIGVSPNFVTFTGLAVSGIGAYFLSVGLLWAGGIVLLASGIFDFLDGALARLTNRTSRFGALLDSIADRLSEAIVLLGLLIFYARGDSSHDIYGTILVYLAVMGSIMVSYLRARSEGLGIQCKVGIMTRPERVITLSAGLILGHWFLPSVMISLGVIAGLTFVTATQRLVHSWRTLNAQNIKHDE